MSWFDLAELLHMSAARCREEVSYEEMNYWQARARIKEDKE
jgi:hypothetical protein